MTDIRRSGWWAPPAIAAILWLVPLPERAVEDAYSRGIYRVIQTTLTAISNLTPFAWLDVWVLVGVLVGGWRLLCLARVAREAGVRQAVGEGVRRVARAIGMVVIAFLVLWGFNYRRVPLDEVVPAGPSGISVDDLRETLVRANAVAADVRPFAVVRPLSYSEAADALRDPFNLALDQLGRPALGVFGRPKYTLLTPYFTWAGINGMIDPFGLESIVHPDALPFERPFILAHEWGHLAGQADEAEASAVGWLACMNGDAMSVYSGVVYLVVELADALPVEVWRDVAPSLDPGLREDLRALNARWARSQPIVRKASSEVYDKYLRANRVDDGVKSYSRALQLIMRPSLRQHLTTYQFDRFRPR